MSSSNVRKKPRYLKYKGEPIAWINGSKSSCFWVEISSACIDDTSFLAEFSFWLISAGAWLSENNE